MMLSLELIELTKVCKKCGERKSYMEFHKNKTCKFGVVGTCKVCKLRRSRKYYDKNKKKVLLRQKEHRIKNKEKVLLYRREYQIKNKKKLSIHQKEYYKNNKQKIAMCQKKYQIKNKEKLSIHKKKYQIKNKKKLSIHQKEYAKAHRKEINIYCKTKRQSDPKFKLRSNISNAIRQSLKKGKAGKGGTHWEKLVGYTIKDLIKRLKKTIPKGYTWDDFLKKNTLHIDHIIPVSAHNFTDTNHEDFKRCWSLSNMQLLPAKENLTKSASLEKPFQRSLLM